MEYQEIIKFVMEMVGTVAFAASGAMVAADCAMDIVGAMVCVWLFKKKLTCIKQKKKQFRLLLLAYKRGNQYIVFVFMIKAEYPEELRSLLHRYVS